MTNQVKRKMDRRSGALGQLFARMMCKNEFRAWLSVRDNVCEDVIDCHVYDCYVKPVGGARKVVDALREFNSYKEFLSQFSAGKQIQLTSISVADMRNKFCF